MAISRVNPDLVTVVSGLPRSGTSMMMKMLEAGGIPVLIDNIRRADEDNPKGYYEFERVKKIKEDKAWLEDAKGHVVKMVSQLLRDLPPAYAYKIVFMRRRMPEILASQRQMLIRNDKPTDAISDERLTALFEKHLRDMEAWLATQGYMDVTYVQYNDMLANPRENVDRINQFLGGHLDCEAMMRVVDRTLYRQQR